MPVRELSLQHRAVLEGFRGEFMRRAEHEHRHIWSGCIQAHPWASTALLLLRVQSRATVMCVAVPRLLTVAGHGCVVREITVWQCASQFDWQHK